MSFSEGVEHGPASERELRRLFKAGRTVLKNFGEIYGDPPIAMYDDKPVYESEPEERTLTISPLAILRAVPKAHEAIQALGLVDDLTMTYSAAHYLDASDDPRELDVASPERVMFNAARPWPDEAPVQEFYSIIFEAGTWTGAQGGDITDQAWLYGFTEGQLPITHQQCAALRQITDHTAVALRYMR